ncbi:unnamed protein product, partial [Discosporangium mesarthrocarpum]
GGAGLAFGLGTGVAFGFGTGSGLTSGGFGSGLTSGGLGAGFGSGFGGSGGGGFFAGGGVGGGGGFLACFGGSGFFGGGFFDFGFGGDSFSGCLDNSSIETTSTATGTISTRSDCRMPGRPTITRTRSPACSNPEIMAPYRITHLDPPAPVPDGSWVRSATRVKPARFTVPITSITCP